MRIERVVLEHHGDVARSRGEPRHRALAEEDLAIGDVLDAGRHLHGRALAATGRAEQCKHLAFAASEIEIFDRGHAAVSLPYGVEPDRSHSTILPVRCPMSRTIQVLCQGVVRRIVGTVGTRVLACLFCVRFGALLGVTLPCMVRGGGGRCDPASAAPLIGFSSLCDRPTGAETKRRRCPPPWACP